MDKHPKYFSGYSFGLYSADFFESLVVSAFDQNDRRAALLYSQREKIIHHRRIFFVPLSTLPIPSPGPAWGRNRGEHRSRSRTCKPRNDHRKLPLRLPTGSWDKEGSERISI